MKLVAVGVIVGMYLGYLAQAATWSCVRSQVPTVEGGDVAIKLCISRW